MIDTERVAHDVTLVMTILNEESGIASFLDSVSAQDLWPEKIVIVDGGSTDSTLAIVRAWDPPVGVDLLVVAEPGMSISAGRNHGIALATTTKVVITDGGTHLTRTWLSELVHGWGTADVASGFFEPQRGNFLATTIATTITPHISEIDASSFLPSSRSVGFRKEAWSKSGGYPEWLDYCEDLIFDISMKKDGAQFVFIPSAIVTWEGRTSLQDFSKQYYRYARGDGKASLFAKRHAARYAAYFAGVLLIGFAIVTSPWFWLLLTAGGSIYLSKFVRRQFKFRALLQSQTLAALALLPVIVILGDLAKMAGYPAGLVWRHRRAQKALQGSAKVTQ